MLARPTIAIDLSRERLPPVVASGVVAAALGLAGVAAIVFSRRIAGALDRPVPVMLLLATAIVVGACCWGTRRLGYLLHPRGESSALGIAGTIVAWAPSAAVVLLTVGLSWPLGRLVDWLIWAPLWIADAWWRRGLSSGVPLPEKGGGRSREISLQRGDDSSVAASSDTGEAAAAVVLQQLTRLRNEHGQESIVGSLRAEFAPGQRTAELYVGFCPPFDGAPEIEMEQTDGPQARLSVGQILPHGVRIDIRLSEVAAAGGEVVLDVYASSCVESLTRQTL